MFQKMQQKELDIYKLMLYTMISYPQAIKNRYQRHTNISKNRLPQRRNP